MFKKTYTDPKVFLQQGARRSQLRKKDFLFDFIPMLMHFVSQTRSNLKNQEVPYILSVPGVLLVLPLHLIH